MKTCKLVLFLLVPAVLLFTGAAAALAFPPLPASFYGVVRGPTGMIQSGTPITATINGVQFAASTIVTYGSDLVYSLDVPGDQPDTPAVEGGTEGDTVVFYIGGRPALPTGRWHSGENMRLNLLLADRFLFIASLRRS